MASNTYDYNQVSSVINEVFKIATGQESVDALAGGDVVSVAQKALSVGYDNFNKALSQVIANTIFSIRPYTRKFAGLVTNNVQFGQITRKIKPVQKLAQDEKSLPLNDGSSVDPYKISKHTAVQFNFIGQNGWEYQDTRPDWQLDNAVRSAEELGSYFAMVTTDALNTIEKYHEETARFTVCNMITGIHDSRTNDVIHLLTEYNSRTGKELTATTVYAPENYPDFIRWAYSRINTIADLMTEFSINFHTNLTDAIFNQHTPRQYQRLYILAPEMYDISARVLSVTFDNSKLGFGEYEKINFWQGIDDPAHIKMTPTYLDPATGNIKAASAAVEIDNVFAILTDVDAMGYTIFNNRVRSQYNAEGEYTNTFWKFTDRYWCDFTENAVIFLMD